MSTITFFSVCEARRSGAKVYVVENSVGRLFSFSTDMQRMFFLVDSFSISTGESFLVVRK